MRTKKDQDETSFSGRIVHGAGSRALEGHCIFLSISTIDKRLSALERARPFEAQCNYYHKQCMKWID